MGGKKGGTSYAPKDVGSAAGELTDAQKAVPLMTPPIYQGTAGMGWDENKYGAGKADVYASFLPRKAGAPALGEDEGILNSILGISPHGEGWVPEDTTQVAAAEEDPASKLQKLTPEEMGELRSLQYEQASSHGLSGPGSAAMIRYLANNGSGARINELRKKSMTPEQIEIDDLRQKLAGMQMSKGSSRWGSERGGSA